MSTTRVKVKYATIFIFPAPAKGRAPVVTTSPERLTVRRGDVVDWTVVDATGAATPREITIGWEGRNPLEEVKPFPRATRAAVKKAKDGIYKYSVIVDGKVAFDPEIEIVS